MDISINSRMATSPTSVVCDSHVWISDEPIPMVTFVSEIHETHPKDIFCEDCGYRQGTVPIFRCSGAGLNEWSKTYTLLDLYLGLPHKARLRSQMDTWIHESITRQVASCQIRIEIRYEVINSQNTNVSTSWAALKLTYHKSPNSSIVVPQNGTPTFAKSYVDPNTTNISSSTAWNAGCPSREETERDSQRTQHGLVQDVQGGVAPEHEGIRGS